MSAKVTTKGAMKVTVNAGLRNGICIECNVQMEVKDVWIDTKREVDEQIIITPKLLPRAVCPKCGGMTGHLIVRHVSIHAPNPPQCIGFGCLWKFFIDILFSAYLAKYHQKRVTYAGRHRPERSKAILEKYRTGEPAPKTLRQAVIEILKLKFRR